MGFKERVKAFRDREVTQLDGVRRAEEAKRERRYAMRRRLLAVIKPDKPSPEEQRRIAKDFFSQSEFPRLMQELAEVLQGYGSPLPFEFNELGKARFTGMTGVIPTTVKGIPNAVGMYFDWMYDDDTNCRVFAAAAPSGDILVQGSTKTKLHPNEWLGQPDIQEQVMEYHFQNPSKSRIIHYEHSGPPSYN